MKRLPLPLRDIAEIYTSKRVPKSAAALSYCLTLTVFPLLICLNAMIASLHVTAGEIFAVGNGVVPSQTMLAINEYLGYISGNDSEIMLFTGLSVMLTSSSAAFRTIMNIMADIQGKARFKGLKGLGVSFFMSIVFLAVIYFSCIIIVSGEWLMRVLKTQFGINIFSDNWQWIRFLLLFFMLYVIIYSIYKVTSPLNGKQIPRSLGAMIAAALLVVVSMVFSYLIDMSTKYTLVYGSLASIIVLMVWFYSCGIILIMGNVVNIIIDKYENYDAKA